MIRTQIQLTEAQSRQLREAARRTGVSAAEIIRRSVDRFLEHEMPVPSGATRLAALKVTGRFGCDVIDIADRHDHYLDDAYLPPARTPGLQDGPNNATT